MQKRFKAWLLVTLFLFCFSLPSSIAIAFQPPARVGIVDILLNTPETANGTDMDWLSGAVIRQGGRDVNKSIAPKGGKSAPHIEYADVFNMGVLGDVKGVSIPTKGQIDNPISVKGKRWIVGTKQLVKGGFGILQCAGPMGCFEFAGRKVVNIGTDTPDEFKLVLMSINKTENTATFQAYVRACIKFKKRWKTCTPYSIPTFFMILIKQNMPMPIDIAVPAFGFKLSPNAIASMKGILSPQNLKNFGIQAGVSIASNVAPGVTSGSGGSSSRGGGNRATPEPVQVTVDRRSYGTALTPSGSGLATGRIIMPFAGNAPITGKWGEDRGTHNHKGVDFALPTGTPIRASDGGVAYPMVDKDYGNFIVIDHQNGQLTLFAHLDQHKIASGQRVSQGDIIGISGNTGRSSGPHLHFEVIEGATPGNIYSGRDVNPLKHLIRR